ncbi:hypothetical protein WT83_05020 [Burkholderia territorii]|uniref:OmpR/PhoB-type domain-containing protein n=2 Tax=Burkholderia territorii TaxID=1503055 RepID=A0A108F2S9_9BURK|nr:hypothetical protein WT83_05020 [Burkholderia territorii]
MVVLTTNAAMYNALKRRFEVDGMHEMSWYRDRLSLIRKLMHSQVDLLIIDVSACEDVDVLMHWRDLHRLNHLPILLVNLTAESGHWLSALSSKDDVAWGMVPQEVYMRAHRLVDHAPTRDLQQLAIGGYTLDRGSQQVRIDMDTIKLTEREFKLAWMLFSHAGLTVKRDTLAEMIWGKELALAAHSLGQYICQLKHKLHLVGTHGVVLRSVYGVGYRIEPVSNVEMRKGRARGDRHRDREIAEEVRNATASVAEKKCRASK